ncbi:MAG: hypothetical protein GY780_05945 [bacterium]|nr:hypothetical protein [bacterium]
MFYPTLHLKAHFFIFALIIGLVQITPALADDIGGDDVNITSDEYLTAASLDIADDGTMFAAHEIGSNDGTEIHVLRSTDEGESWQPWEVFSGPEILDSYREPSLKVIEGTVSRCYLLFTRVLPSGYNEIRMVNSPLDTEQADFGPEVVVFSEDDVSFSNASFTSSLLDYNWFYLFVVAEGKNGYIRDIWFTRGLDLGDSFEAGYALTNNIVFSNGKYPDIDFGPGSVLHVAWYHESYTNDFDDAIRYRRAEHGANWGLADWNNTKAITPTHNEYYENYPQVKASPNTDEVVVAYSRLEQTSPDSYMFQDPAVRVSNDAGVTFGSETQFLGPHRIGGIVVNPNNDKWTIAGGRSSAGLTTAQSGELENWNTFQQFADQYGNIIRSRYCSLALNPNRSNREALLWIVGGVGEPSDIDNLYFDGMWRNDPGYPNMADGFPVSLANEPTTPVALVDLTGNGNQEIVFSDQAHYIHAYNSDGFELPGWPVLVPEGLSTSPVAIGDLQNNGQMTVIAGTLNGWVHAYDWQGIELSGWPIYLESNNPAYVSIGSPGVVYPDLAAVVCCGPRIRIYNSDGETPPNNPGWIINSHTFENPAVIGDVDGDGYPEVVGSIDDRVFAYFSHDGVSNFFHQMPSNATNPLSLVDLDQDGDQEILYPAVGSNLYALGDDGLPLGGYWPYHFPGGGHLSSASAGRIMGATHPYIAVASSNQGVVLLDEDGLEVSGYPVDVGSAWHSIWGTPTIGLIEGSIPEVLFGSEDDQAYSFDHDGNISLGWPKNVGSDIWFSPAIGDIDDDGGNEVVILSDNELTVVNVLTSPGDPERMWPMYGHDAQRTGCADCQESMLSPVAENFTAGTKVRFAGASPNPVQGPSNFHFSVPRDAKVSLTIHDLRGRKLLTIEGGTFSLGEHFIAWNGKDDRGHPLASGQYLARLRVVESGGETISTRKLMVLR